MKKHVITLILLLLVVSNASAQKFIHIVNYSNGLALTNNEIGTNNARIYFASEDNAKWGQAWEFRAYNNSTEVFYLVNPYYEMAIDLNPYGSYPLQWQYSTSDSGPNQRFYVQEVEGLDGVYQILNNEIPQNSKYAARSKCLGIENGNPQIVTYSLTDQTTYWYLKEIDLNNVETPDVETGDNVWENQTIFGINKEKARATAIPYPSRAALQADAEVFAKPWLTPTSDDSYLSLNGVWKFLFASNTDERPGSSFYGDDVDASSWADITVPGCWEMFGYDKPMYLNVEYAFTDNPPYIANKVSGVGDNPVGSYRRTFTLPSGWENQRVFLHFDGLYSGAFVWVNGKKVGYTQGGNNDAEFDLTKYVRTGENNLCVQVIRWTDGSYLEGQDMFHMSGLHRDVYLYATPNVFLRDHYITATPTAASNYTAATVNVDLEVANKDGVQSQKGIKVTVLSPSGEQVAAWNTTVSFAEGDTLKTVTLSNDLTNLLPWTAETPNLYTFIFQQFSNTSLEEMAFQTKYGFRNIEIKNNLVYINGKRVYFYGVNTQDTHPVYGRSIDVETMLKDITMMKQANVNTVRCSHYPRQPKMYDMFDYYGIYVMDEADVECHKNWNDKGNSGISNDVSWQPQFLDRTERMVYRDRNHPSIIFWSLGNESAIGQNFQATYNRCKALDTRPVHYEGATNGGASYTDLCSQMYPALSAVSSKCSSNTKPYIMCEYAHAMGNGVGNLQEYWDIIEGSTYGIGGCIWDWVDQAVYNPADLALDATTGNLAPTTTEPRFISGYDMPGPAQGNFLDNGIVSPNREWNGKLAEVKKVYQPATCEWVTIGSAFSIKNKLSFTDLADIYDLYVVKLTDGRVVATIKPDFTSCAPGATTTVTFTDPTTTPTEGDTYYNVELRLKAKTPYADAGYVAATTQLPYLTYGYAAPTPEVEGQGSTTLSYSYSNSTHVLTSANLTLQVASTGFIKSFVSNGVTIIDENSGINQPIYSNIRWIENESPYGNHNFGDTSASNTSNSCTTPSVSGSTATWKVTAKNSKCSYVVDYTLLGDGTLKMKIAYTPSASGLRRIGMDMKFPAGFENVTYYARGPEANYIDRCSGSYVGLYNTTVDGMYEGYFIHPQSCGNRTDMQFLEMTNPDNGQTIRVTCDEGSSFSLSHYDQADFLSATVHQYELTKHDEIYATFDYMQRGLGNGSCGPGTIDAYLCPSSGTYTRNYQFLGYTRTAYDLPTLVNYVLGREGGVRQDVNADGNCTISDITNLIQRLLEE